MSKSYSVRVLFLGIASLVLVSWLGYDIFTLASASVETRVFIVRVFGLLFVVLLGGVLAWMFYRRRFSLRTFVFVVPTLAALCALPLPYLMNTRSLRQRLDEAGIVYKLEPTEFESRLDWLTVTLLGPKFSGLYATQLKNVELHLDRCQGKQLATIRVPDSALCVTVVRSSRGGQFDDEVVKWLNALPDRVHSALVISQIEHTEIDCLKQLHRQNQYLICRDMSVDQTTEKLLSDVEAKVIQFQSVDFSENLHAGAGSKSCRRLNLMDCNLREEQIVQLAHDKACAELSVSGCGPFSVAQCERLSNEEQLKRIEFGSSQQPAKLGSIPTQLGINRLRDAGKIVFTK